MNQLKAFAAGGVALMLVSSATAARAQTAPSTMSVTENDNAIDERLALLVEGLECEFFATDCMR